jgi:hypothetical protein
VKLRIRARTGQAGGAHARNGISGRLRRLTATTLVLATITGGGLAAYGLTASTPASARTTAQAAAPILITGKAANSMFFTGSGQVITYTFTVTNSNTVGFLNVSVSDSKIGPVCFIGTIPPASPGMPVIRTCMAKYTTTPADVRAGVILNTATVFVRGIPSGMSPTVRVRFIPPGVPVTG